MYYSPVNYWTPGWIYPRSKLREPFPMRTKTVIISSGGGSLPGPTTPTLGVTDNGNGTATMTVSSASPGSANTIYYRPQLGGGWVSLAGPVGSGSVVATLNPGAYFGYDASTLNSQTSDSTVIVFIIGNVASSSVLANSPADIIRWLLINLGALGNPTTLQSNETYWPGYATREPDGVGNSVIPDNVVTLYDTPGNKDGRYSISGAVPEHYGIQIRIRCQNPTDGWMKARALAIICDETINRNYITLNNPTGQVTYLVRAMSRLGNIVSLGKDVGTSKRSIFTINFTASISQLV